jgi:hypothetical protein
MMKISGRLRQRSTQTPPTTASGRSFDRRVSARSRPKMSEKTIAIAAISRLTRNALSRNSRLLPLHSHSQLLGSKR